MMKERLKKIADRRNSRAYDATIREWQRNLKKNLLSAAKNGKYTFQTRELDDTDVPYIAVVAWLNKHPEFSWNIKRTGGIHDVSIFISWES